MALSTRERREIERWTGGLDEDAVTEVDLRLQALGHTGVVAYEILMVRYAEMITNPDELRLEGDARVRWVKAREDLQAQVYKLVQWWTGLDPAPVLNAEATDLMGTATAGTGRHRVTTSSYVMSNLRP